MKISLVLFPLLSLYLTLPTPTRARPSLVLPDLTDLSLPYLQPRRRASFFSDNTLTSVKRSFQDIQNNVGRSVSSLLEAGSAIGQRVLGIITRPPRLIGVHPPPHPQNPHLPPVEVHSSPGHIALPHHHGGDQTPPGQYPDFEDCDCQFGYENEVPKFEPYIQDISTEVISNNVVFPESYIYESPEDLETYGSPLSPVQSSRPPTTAVIEDAPVAPAEDSYGVPVAPVYIPTTAPVIVHEVHEIPHPVVTAEHPKGGHNPHVADILAHENDVGKEVVIHPGGSTDIDVHKVEVLGAASVVQTASAKVPDQNHPEKYQNFDSDLLQDLVEINLWYKDTKKFKHHKHGEKNKVIPHLQVI